MGFDCSAIRKLKVRAFIKFLTGQSKRRKCIKEEVKAIYEQFALWYGPFKSGPVNLNVRGGAPETTQRPAEGPQDIVRKVQNVIPTMEVPVQVTKPIAKMMVHTRLKKCLTMDAIEQARQRLVYTMILCRRNSRAAGRDPSHVISRYTNTAHINGYICRGYKQTCRGRPRARRSAPLMLMDRWCNYEGTDAPNVGCAVAEIGNSGAKAHVRRLINEFTNTFPAPILNETKVAARRSRPTRLAIEACAPPALQRQVAADAQYHNSCMKKLYQTPSTEERKKRDDRWRLRVGGGAHRGFYRSPTGDAASLRRCARRRLSLLNYSIGIVMTSRWHEPRARRGGAGRRRVPLRRNSFTESNCWLTDRQQIVFTVKLLYVNNK
ncbi:hypothetical protein EVAR_66960_1 [Eumeta japonica]|uniref:Uncharacterized protein n=1 Tax=Eumeta variegata TaxID=151549 RepID=A0A4C1ZX84_EUMVA|nr:hypothetical protein EVAR_66960_1 [Eumeta japonica]